MGITEFGCDGSTPYMHILLSLPFSCFCMTTLHYTHTHLLYFGTHTPVLLNLANTHTHTHTHTHTRTHKHTHKLTVKPDLPANYEAQTWEKLREAINAVHTQRPICYRYRSHTCFPSLIPASLCCLKPGTLSINSVALVKLADIVYK